MATHEEAQFLAAMEAEAEEREAKAIDMWRLADSISIMEPAEIAGIRKIINETQEKLQIACDRHAEWFALQPTENDDED